MNEDLVIKMLEDLSARLAKIETVLLIPTPEVPAAPARTDGLYRFVRPAVRDVAQFGDRDMTSADADEAFRRSLHGVNWRGGFIADTTYEEAWAEIEALKSGDEKLISVYRDSGIDPEFAGYALLTGGISPAKYDAITFGQNAKNRAALAGFTIKSFIAEQMGVAYGGGSPSGG